MTPLSKRPSPASSSSGHGDCPICLDPLYDCPSASSSSVTHRSGPVFLPCSHAFHGSCVQALKSARCPVCRTSFGPPTDQSSSPTGRRTKLRGPFLDPKHLCTICQKTIAHGTRRSELHSRFKNPRTTLPCGHFFHHACIAGHIEKHKNCPRCRAAQKPSELPGTPEPKRAVATMTGAYTCVTCYLPVAGADAVAVQACADKRHASHTKCEQYRAAFKQPCNGCRPGMMQSVARGSCAVCKGGPDRNKPMLPTNWPCGHLAHAQCASSRLRSGWLCPACRGMSVHVAEKMIKAVVK